MTIGTHPDGTAIPPLPDLRFVEVDAVGLGLEGSRLSYMEGQPLWERLKAGYVVDFLDFTIPLVNYRWPSFNVADSCIFVAAFVLFFTGLKADLKKAA